MPQTRIDSKLALEAVAREVGAQTGTAVAALLSDLKFLDEKLNSCKQLSWENIGKQIGQQR